MMAISNITISMEKEPIIELMEEYILANGKIIRLTEKANLLELMEGRMKENI